MVRIRQEAPYICKVMDKIEVGEIQGFPVYYIPNRRLLFCKNTIVPLDKMKEVLDSGLNRHRIERSKLTITKFDNIIELGCLTTTITNLNTIRKKISRYE